MSLDIPLGAGATLRATLVRDEHGEPAALILALGFGGGDSGDSFSRPAWAQAPLSLPATALRALPRALEVLASS